jgi:hypothetical protein
VKVERGDLGKSGKGRSREGLGGILDDLGVLLCLSRSYIFRTDIQGNIYIVIYIVVYMYIYTWYI